MKLGWMVFSLVVSASASAEVFKCTDKLGKTVYQAKPCLAASKSEQLEIIVDPVKEAEAKARLEALEADREAKKAAQLEAERISTTQRSQVESAEALKQSAIAQQQQAYQEQRQADALERQAQQSRNQTIIVTPPVMPRMEYGNSVPVPTRIAPPVER